MTWLWDTSPTAFMMFDIVIGGAAAAAAGRAIAQHWDSRAKVVGFMLLLGLAVRFCHLALLWESTTELTHWAIAGGWTKLVYYWLIDSLVLTFIALLSYQITRTDQMVTQYPWLYRRTSPITWGDKRN